MRPGGSGGGTFGTDSRSRHSEDQEDRDGANLYLRDRCDGGREGSYRGAGEPRHPDEERTAQGRGGKKEGTGEKTEGTGYPPPAGCGNSEARWQRRGKKERRKYARTSPWAWPTSRRRSTPRSSRSPIC